MSIQHSAVYMSMARMMASKSKAVRRKVGAILVTETGVVVPGYNGTHAGLSNVCEDTLELYNGEPVLVTRPDVIHAEMNVMAKACREGISTKGSVLYLTLSPCIECAKLLAAAGVVKVVYAEEYRDTAGIVHLNKCGVETEHMT